MEVTQIKATKARINPKIERGDYVTLSKIIDLTPSAAAARYKRNKEVEVLLMRKIVSNRERLIEKLKNSLTKKQVK